jgi:hypothetical protein
MESTGLTITIPDSPLATDNILVCFFSCFMSCSLLFLIRAMTLHSKLKPKHHRILHRHIRPIVRNLKFKKEHCVEVKRSCFQMAVFQEHSSVSRSEVILPRHFPDPSSLFFFLPILPTTKMSSHQADFDLRTDHSDLNVHARPWIPGQQLASPPLSSSSQQQQYQHNYSYGSPVKMRMTYSPYDQSHQQLQYFQAPFVMPVPNSYPAVHPNYHYPSPDSWGSAA